MPHRTVGVPLATDWQVRRKRNSVVTQQSVVLGARREHQLRQLVDEIQKAGGQAVYQVMDVVNPSDNAQIVKLAKETFGGVDVIFLNAGIMPNSPLSTLKTDE